MHCFGIALSQESIDRMVWMHEHRWRIAERIKMMREHEAEYKTLRKVAKLIGYEERA